GSVQHGVSDHRLYHYDWFSPEGRFSPSPSLGFESKQWNVDSNQTTTIGGRMTSTSPLMK
ncbi:hypothetical protein P7K49_025011, partial [Saguinus oedipus]